MLSNKHMIHVGFRILLVIFTCSTDVYKKQRNNNLRSNKHILHIAIKKQHDNEREKKFIIA